MGFTNTLVLQAGAPGVPDYLQEAVAGVINFLPQLLAAVVILLIGWVIGRLVGGGVRRLADRTEVDRLVMKTPLGGALGGTESTISRSIGRVGTYFVYALAIFAAASLSEISVSTSKCKLPYPTSLTPYGVRSLRVGL